MTKEMKPKTKTNFQYMRYSGDTIEETKKRIEDKKKRLAKIKK